MESTQAENTDASNDMLTLANGLQIEFINVYEETDDDLALAMNCSNG